MHKWVFATMVVTALTFALPAYANEDDFGGGDDTAMTEEGMDDEGGDAPAPKPKKAKAAVEVKGAAMKLTGTLTAKEGKQGMTYAITDGKKRTMLGNEKKLAGLNLKELTDKKVEAEVIAEEMDRKGKKITKVNKVVSIKEVK